MSLSELWVNQKNCGCSQITKVKSYLNWGTRKKKKKRVFADLDTKHVFFLRMFYCSLGSTFAYLQ
jgi:hypothetical protein